MTLDSLPEFLTVHQIAELVAMHPNSIYLRCKSGELKSIKTGNIRRIRKDVFLEWLQAMEQTG